MQQRPHKTARFEKALAEYRNANGDYGKDYNWAYCWAQRQPNAEYLARWIRSSALASANYQTTLDNRRTRAKADLDRKVMEWEGLQKKRIDAKTRSIKLAESDQQKWESLSFWLGGKYLLPFCQRKCAFQAVGYRLAARRRQRSRVSAPNAAPSGAS